MDVQLYKLPIAKGKEPIAEEWLCFLTDNKDKALQTLAAEKVYFESYFKETINEQLVIYLLMLCKDHVYANTVARESKNEIDIKHFEYMKACVDLDAINIMNADLWLDNLHTIETSQQ